MREAHYRKGIREGRWVKTLEDNRIFDSISAASREYGVTRQAIIKSIKSGCCAGGVHWADATNADRPKNLKPLTPWGNISRRKKSNSKPKNR